MMLRGRYSSVWIVLVLWLAAACQQRGVLDNDSMKRVMWDLARADEFALNYLQRDTTLSLNEKTKELYAKVFSLHKITQQQFLESLRYYKADPEEMKELLDSLNTHANRMREAQFMQNAIPPDSSGQSKLLPDEKSVPVPR
jgi:hypothetical protein